MSEGKQVSQVVKGGEEAVRPVVTRGKTPDYRMIPPVNHHRRIEKHWISSMTYLHGMKIVFNGTSVSYEMPVHRPVHPIPTNPMSIPCPPIPSFPLPIPCPPIPMPVVPIPPTPLPVPPPQYSSTMMNRQWMHRGVFVLSCEKCIFLFREESFSKQGHLKVCKECVKRIKSTPFDQQ